VHIAKKLLVASAAAGALALGSSATAMAATPAATPAPTPPALTAVQATQAIQGLGYTFDHDTAVAIYDLATQGAEDAVVGLCEAIVPEPLGSTICPYLGSLASSIAPLGAPGPNDKLYVGFQLGWPPVVIEYVQ
jgi:hypothetical protein